MSAKRLAWYTAERGKVYTAVAGTVNSIKTQQSLPRLDMMHFLDLYSLGNVAGMGRSLSDLSASYIWNASGYARGYRGARFNICKAACDSAHSMIAASPSVPIYITSGTNLSVVRKAARRTKVLQSQVNLLAMSASREAYLTACKTGTGCIFGYLDEDDMPKLEPVNPLELIIDQYDGYYRQPRSITREKYVHREVLAEMYPSKRHQIENMAGVVPDYVSRFMLTGVDTESMVTVWESWHKAPSKNKPGRHTITCTACDLLDEPWSEDDYPFAFVRYKNREQGFFGEGLCESAREAQVRINKMIYRVAKAQDLASNLLIFNPMGENALEGRWLTNEIGLVFDYDPTLGPPSMIKWEGTLIDLQQQIETEFERLLVVEGLSQSQVSGEGAGKGLSSGVAVRAQDDVMSRRLVNQIELFQQFNMDVAKLIERLNDRALMKNPDYEARGYSQSAGVHFLQTSRWGELALEEGEACLNIMPMNLMPTTPAGKWAAVSEWLESGFLDKQGAMKLLQFPSIDETALLETAQMDLCLWQLEKALDGEMVLPEERQDLNLCIQLATKVWARAQMMDPGPDVQYAFDEYLAHAQTLLDAAQKAAAAAAAAASAGPGAPAGAGPGAPGAGAAGALAAQAA